MENSCEYYGSTYKGRLTAAKKMLNSSYKLPIIIEESENIIFFPTKSSLLDDCCWINYNYIKKYEKLENRVKITFKNNDEINVDMSKLSLDNQISRSSMLELISRKRKISKK
jgi:competence protein ComK